MSDAIHNFTIPGTVLASGLYEPSRDPDLNPFWVKLRLPGAGGGRRAAVLQNPFDPAAPVALEGDVLLYSPRRPMVGPRRWGHIDEWTLAVRTARALNVTPDDALVGVEVTVGGHWVRPERRMTAHAPPVELDWVDAHGGAVLLALRHRLLPRP